MNLRNIECTENVKLWYFKMVECTFVCVLVIIFYIVFDSVSVILLLLLNLLLWFYTELIMYPNYVLMGSLLYYYIDKFIIKRFQSPKEVDVNYTNPLFIY